MKLIGENIHIISKKTKEAVSKKDSMFVQDLAKRQQDAGMDWIDLNIGPARKGWEGTMDWLSKTIQEVTNPVYSFDTTNIKEMEAGLLSVGDTSKCIINSTNADSEKLDVLTDLAAKYNCYLIALTMSGETGIPKEADERLELACAITEATAEKEIDNGKVIIDPLVLPVGVDQTQVMEALNSIRMFKESFDPPVLTTIGLSNVSNGCPKENRALINRVFAVMAMGCGLDTAIADAFDSELLRVNKIIESLTPQKDSDKLLIDIHNMMQEFGELEDVSYDSGCSEQTAIYKTAAILMNKNIYSHNYLDI